MCFIKVLECLQYLARQRQAMQGDTDGGGFFSIICDEHTDISNKEQLTICIPWVDKELEAHEISLALNLVLTSEIFYAAERIVTTNVSGEPASKNMRMNWRFQEITRPGFAKYLTISQL